MIENKYASALDGLEIEDPVQSFFDFCKEREKIRISRENGEDFPWSKDEIFQNGRFLNVFREDDRVSKSIIKFAGNLNEEPSKLINAVFFARWCNRQEVLDTLTPDDLNNPENLKNSVFIEKYMKINEKFINIHEKFIKIHEKFMKNSLKFKKNS